MRLTQLILVPLLAFGQQVADTAYAPKLGRPPSFRAGSGPKVAIDEAHFNFHTVTGRYEPAANVLRSDGYTVEANKSLLSRNSLAGTKVLMIANAIHESNSENWSLPRKSAFTADEIRELLAWVKDDGGGLFLIADHMPFAGAAEELGQALGIEFTDGYVSDPSRKGPLPDLFTIEAKTLLAHPVTDGLTSIGTFTGSAFRAPKAIPILRLGPQFVSVMPEVIGKVDANTPRLPVGGWLQGALQQYGKGRIAVFGEAAMFSAQLAGPSKQPMGMNHPKASENYRLLISLVRWLTGT